MPGKRYICVDIEADGPEVGKHPMRSIGAVAVYEQTPGVWVVDSEFTVNIEPHGEIDPQTLSWWMGWPAARGALDPNQRTPLQAITEFTAWYYGFERPVFVTDAPWFDYPFIRWYMLHYLGDNTRLTYFPYTWVARGARINLKRIANPKPHVAIYDAREMAEQFIWFMKKWRTNGQPTQTD